MESSCHPSTQHSSSCPPGRIQTPKYKAWLQSYLCCPQGSPPFALRMHRTPASCHALDPCAHMSPHHCTGCPRTGVLLPGCLSKPRLWNPLSSQSSNSAGMCPGTGREAQTDFPPSRMPRTWCHLLSADEEPRLCHQASLTQHLSQGRSNSLYTTVYYHTARHSAVHPAPDIHASSRHCQSSPRSPELVPSPIYELAEAAVWAPSSGRQCL